MDRKERYQKQIKKRVLIVEDEYINREMLGFMLNREYEVLYAENGKEALDTLRNTEDISAVLLDLMMPVMNGFEFLDISQGDSTLKRIPVIVMTADETAEVKSLNLGAADFISKPYDAPEVILARIKRIIELAEDKLIINATERDELTGLYTRKFFQEYAAQLDHYYPDWKMDAVSLDIDNFHLINELYGKSFGDKVLVRIADLLRESLSTMVDGYACRYDRDMFYMYCTHLDDYEPLRRHIIDGLADLTDTHKIRVRFGVYLNVDRDMEFEQRFVRAKRASDSIKGDYSKRIAVYDTEAHNEALLSQKLISDVQTAIKNNELIVYYQPKYAIDGETPVLKSAEALIRWNHPEFGMLPPSRFVPLFEQNGLIQLLDHFVWKEAARQIKEWKGRLGKTVPVSVNVSRMDIYDDRLEERLVSLVEDNGLESGELLLEITESAYSENPEQLIEAVDKLRKRAFFVEMDDFGSGYSSLNMLSVLPVDALKLDMQFVRNMHKDEKSLRLIELIMGIADYLSVPVIAEGVEEKEQLDLLKKVGCSIVQGYYFSKPVAPDEFEKFL
ncbi:MAG: EAL domain-containing protein [Lachnospiraceae bacterium]|nr:EAL domain-containing protein [Lachnospiraceae bacterium]